jgi:hypothetical protein
MTGNYRSVSAKVARRKGLPLARLQLLLAILAIAPGSRALAQTAPTGSNDPSQPYFYPAPPEGFNAVTASDADLATYGFPLRPALTSVSYDAWVNRVSALRTRLTNPTVQPTNLINGLPGSVQRLAQSGTNGTDTGVIWAGLGVSSPNNYFIDSGSMVGAGWQIPSIGTENCSYPIYTASQWVGFDGFNPQNPSGPGSQDVLQAGITLTACSSSYPSYVAWYEWYTGGCVEVAPCPQTNVSLPVAAGDYFFVWVIYKYSDNPSYEATAVLSNQSTGQYISVGFNQPAGGSGSQYAGESAEWIVERQGCTCFPNPSYISNLVNFSSFYMGGLDLDSPYYDWNPSQVPDSTLTNFYMTCAPWSPSSACSPPGGNILQPTYNGVTDLTFTPLPPASTQ